MKRYPAAERKFETQILFVPYFGGTETQLKRHIQFVNRLGYDAAFVDLQFPNLKDPRPPLSRDGLLGLKHLWADRIEDALSEISGPVVLYTFSSPTASALEAIARTLHLQKTSAPWIFKTAGRFLWKKKHTSHLSPASILGIVCDSGPFVNLWTCNWKYMYHEAGIEFPPLRGLATAASILLWGPDYETSLRQDLKTIGSRIPILNIRGWNDKLVSVKAIDDAFPRDAVLNLKVVAIPEADHLEGLKKFPEIYEPQVTEFLRTQDSGRLRPEAKLRP